MKRADENAAEASLELLLDTICNAFGGILFLAIMLSLLLRLSQPSVTEKPVSAESAQHLRELEAELAGAIADISTLESALAIQELAQGKLETAESRKSFDRLSETRRRHAELSHQLLDHQRERAALQNEIVRLSQKTEDVHARSKELAEQVEAERERLRRTLAKSERSVKPSVTRTSRKREFMFLMRYGKIYEPHFYVNDFSRVVNEDEMVVTEESGTSQVITPNPLRGVVVSGNSTLREHLQSRLSRRPKNDWHVVIGVWEDSFASFASVRDLLTGMGYEYRLLPASAGDKLIESHVPEPQVQ